MVELVAQHRVEIEALCRKYLVRKLELFGSATDPSRFDEHTSDIDFLYEIDLEREDLADRYFGFHEDLEKLLNRKVDLVATRAITNRFFLKQVDAERVTVYAA